MLWGNFGAEKTEVEVPLVPPGEEYVVQVDFVAPDGPGTYQSHWRLCAPSGAWFGHRIWCSIVVVEEREEMTRTTDPSIIILDEQNTPDSQPQAQVIDMTQVSQGILYIFFIHAQFRHTEIIKKNSNLLKY